MSDRTDGWLPQIKGLLAEVTGEDLASVNSTSSFFDLGFDSLVLTQLSQSLQSRFGVKVTFRQMMEELSTVGLLAAHLDTHSPIKPGASSTAGPAPQSNGQSNAASSPSSASAKPMVNAAPAPAPAVATMPSAAPGAPLSEAWPPTEALQVATMVGETGDATPVERVVKQQLQLMAQQLEVLRRVKAPRPVTPPPQGGDLVSAPAAPLGQTPLPAPSRKPVVKAIKGAGEDSKRFGPFKPIEKGPTGGLTPRQEQALTALISRYNRRTAGSKRATQEHRRHFCDPRAAGNFRQLWKEMVYPILCARSLGARIWDIDGNEYVDVTMGFGANYLGHSPDFVVRAVEEQLKKGFEIGPQSPLAGETAQLICEMTGMDRATFCNTGSEAVMAAMRVARTVTGRDKVVYFCGDYHGMFEEVLGRPALVDGLPGAMPIAPGIPHLANIIVLNYADPASLATIQTHAAEIAAVMVEPVQARHPELQPREFLHELRRLTEQHGIALIFDEVITGFRVAPGGAQEYFGVRADLATYGKVIGGGMPIGVLAGKAKFMDALDGGYWQYGDGSGPETGVTFFAGTFVRHPLAMAAANAVLKHLKAAGPELQRAVNERSARFVERVNAFFTERELPMRLQGFSALFYYDFHPDLHYAGLLFYYLRDRGVHIWEGRVCHLSTAHTDADMEVVLTAFKESVLEMQEAGFLPGQVEPKQLPASPVNTSEPAPSAPLPPTANCIPLTAGQTEMWIAAQMRPEASGSQVGSNVVYLHGPLEVEALRRAVSEVIKRHEALRATFSEDGSKIWIAPSLNVHVPLHDLSGLPDGERQEAARRRLEEEGKRIFDLAKGPLVSFQLIRLSPMEHWLVFTVQMVVCDGWSYTIVLEDLAAIYSAMVEGRTPTLKAPMPMRDYVAWQSKQRDSAEAKAAEAFWLEQFKTLPPPLDLPGFATRPPVRSFDGARESLRLNADFYQALKRVAKEQGATPFVLLLAAYQTWLFRLSGNTDLVIGVPFAGQGASGLDGVVGQCVHTLPLRCQLNPEEPFAALLRQTRSGMLDAQEHWNSSFGSLVQKLDLPRDPSRVPLVSVTFNLDVPLNKVRFAGCTHRVEATPRFYFQYDLGFNLVDEGGTLLVECDYNRNLFDAAAVRAWVGHFQALLEGIVADPRQPLRRLPMWTAAERKRLIVEAKDTRRDLPIEGTVHGLVGAQAARTPQAVAVECAGQRFTYAELDRRANRLANHLRSLGAGPDTLVGVCVERSFDLIASLLAVLKAGGAYVPIDPAFPRDRIAQMLEDAGPPLLITQSSLLANLPETKARLVCLDEDSDLISRENPALSQVGTGPENLAYVIYTSSSSGRPKGVEVPHRAVVNFLQSMRREPGLGAEDVVLALTTVSFDIAVLEIFLPLTVGARVVLVARDVLVDPHQLSDTIREAGVTVMQATPATWRMLINAGWKGDPNLKVLCGGEAMPPDLAERLLGCCREVWNMYGPTETTVWSTTERLKKGGPITLGRPIDNTQLYLVDEQFEPVPIGVPGEVLIGGAGVARGYRSRPELTKEKFVPNPFSNDKAARVYRTGDLARYRPDGQVEFIGRRDFQVKLRGFRIELGEIETVLLAHPEVRGAAAVVREDVPGEPRLVAYVAASKNGNGTPATGGVSAFTQELRQWVRKKLPDYMVPSAFVVLDALPCTPAGKVDRLRLPAPTTEDRQTATGYCAPRNRTEETLARIWSETLKLDRVGIRDNFFDLGGQSLLAVGLFARIEKELGRRLPLATLFRAPTIEQLAAALDGDRGTGNRWPSLVPIQPKGARPPLFLVHGAGGNVLLYRALAQHLAPDYPLYGFQSQGLDGQSEPLTTIEAMAAHYLQELRQVQPSGPYFLGGYCLGGTVAYEMARQLLRQGEPVPFIAMLDTYNFARALKGSFAGFLFEKFRFHLGNFLRLRPPEMWAYLVEKARLARDGELANLLTSRPGSAREAGVARAETGIEANVQAINDRAAEAYQPAPLEARLTLFKPQVNYKFYPDPQMGWGDLALGGLDIVELPVNPHAMLVEPYVRRLAAELKTRMDRLHPPAPTEPMPASKRSAKAALAFSQ